MMVEMVGLKWDKRIEVKRFSAVTATDFLS